MMQSQYTKTSMVFLHTSNKQLKNKKLKNISARINTFVERVVIRIILIKCLETNKQCLLTVAEKKFLYMVSEE